MIFSFVNDFDFSKMRVEGEESKVDQFTDNQGTLDLRFWWKTLRKQSKFIRMRSNNKINILNEKNNQICNLKMYRQVMIDFFFILMI